MGCKNVQVISKLYSYKLYSVEAFVVVNETLYHNFSRFKCLNFFGTSAVILHI